LAFFAVIGVLSLIVVLFYDQMGLYGDETLGSPLVGFGKVWGGLAVSFLVLLGLLYTLKISEDFSRIWMFAWFGLAAVGIVYGRSRCLAWLRGRVHSGVIRHRVALVGTPDLVSRLATHLAVACPWSEVEGKFLVGDHQASADFDGGLDDLRQALAVGSFDRIIICIPASEREMLRTTTKGLASYSSELFICSDVAEYPVTISGSRTVGNVRLDVVNIVPKSERSRGLKLMLDCTLAGIGLVLLAPVLALVALVIKLDSKGPVFFRQRRYGQNNTMFRIYKFRTMHVTEDGPVVEQAKRDDARVTRVGWFLRRTSIDELPQLINVLTGDMSLVGPRPHAIAHDEAFERQHDLFSRRRRVRPGITGWAQVNGFRGETRTTEAVQKRMDYDLYYVDNWSIWFDLEIIARTVLVVTRGAY
jgi:putative colanic acid biosynthesis UDP-glucose lipid carrier transferase